MNERERSVQRMVFTSSVALAVIGITALVLAFVRSDGDAGADPVVPEPTEVTEISVVDTVPEVDDATTSTASIATTTSSTTSTTATTTTTSTSTTSTAATSTSTTSTSTTTIATSDTDPSEPPECPETAYRLRATLPLDGSLADRAETVLRELRVPARCLAVEFEAGLNGVSLIVDFSDLEAACEMALEVHDESSDIELVLSSADGDEEIDIDECADSAGSSETDTANDPADDTGDGT